MTNADNFVDSTEIRPVSSKSLYDKCWELAHNLWWSWHPDVIAMFRDLAPERWRKLDHNPIALLREFTPEALETRASEMVLESRINYAYRRMNQYMDSRPEWAAQNVGVLGSKPVAYFSLEFGIHESVPIYSGGLGILAGDHVKSASGLGVPLVAVGLFYDQGYFKQFLDHEGWQQEEYLRTNIDNLPMQPVFDKEGQRLIVKIETDSGAIHARVWKMQVGRVDLYLLDCDLPENGESDRGLTSRLYGGDSRMRIRQEMVVGIGGVRALHALGIHPGVFHLNEGHCAFATLEAVRCAMEDDGISFDEAVRRIAQATCFTTHTPVPAGHDRFAPDLVQEHLGPLQRQLGIDFHQLMSMGRVDVNDHGEYFCMTVLGLKLSRRANAVSCLHGIVSRKMWAPLWPKRSENEVPIGHITNGVHLASWLAWQMQTLFDRYFKPDWIDRHWLPETWNEVEKIDPGELWETHLTLKSLMLEFVERRVKRQSARRGENREISMDPNVLTIGFARRFATYKRATLMMQDFDRLLRMMDDAKRPIQFVFAGKAHPQDKPGKEFIQRITQLAKDERFHNRFVFVEDYDINVARHLVQGVDVWLNNPRRPLEASGTSGQKALLNGVLNCSILDGWWAEAFDGSNGFAIGSGSSHADDAKTDARDAASLMDVLENQVIPMYYHRDSDGLPHFWIRRMMNSLRTMAWRFSAQRMVADYVLEAYLPAAGGVTCDMNFRQ
ncbi:MAG: alpha-glucan family phosphorylase [Planctomycetia bacterium]|nr:alpha-glucan family phosphorylase [Planctomycetia bacterium]